ncbi:MAG: glucose-6-phosphate isomerase, partial [Anaerolineae bacterium]|nr:glucose-6-phosphate isomerase [Anaerolineae bacterium]
MAGLEKTAVWQALLQHQRQISGLHMRDMFAADPQRFARFSLRVGDILFDYSKNRITVETMSLLVDLARQANLSRRIDA